MEKENHIDLLKRLQKEHWDGPVTLPSNGTEALDWESQWCSYCAHEFEEDPISDVGHTDCDLGLFFFKYDEATHRKWRGAGPLGGMICRSWAPAERFDVPANQLKLEMDV